MLFGIWVPFALVLLAPVTVGIVGYHIAIDPAPAGRAVAGVVLAMHLFLAWHHRKAYQGLFAPPAA